MSSINNNSTIDLKAFPARVDDSRFVAVHGERVPEHENIFCLTPHVMQWSEQVYLLDLHSCMSYWNQQAGRLDTDLSELYKKILQSVFGDNCRAVFCEHPWQGLFYLYYLVANGAPGVYSLNSLFNKKAYKKLPWEYWFAALRELGGHLESINARSFRASRFNVKIAQMQRFVQHMQLPGPWALSEAEVSAIKRRYSGWTGEAWGWTWLSGGGRKSRRSSCSHSVMADFPWRALKFRQSISVKRHLDYPLSQWDALEPLLREDLARLCGLGGWSSQDRISSLHWRINLFNLQQMDVHISFRHPCSLHRQAPDFKTALYQAYYAYTDMMQALIDRDQDLDLPAEMPFVSWQLEISHILRMPQIIQDMFDMEKSAGCYERILDLQNCLPNAIEHYAIRPDFVSDQLFEHADIGAARHYDFSLQQWADVDLQRPLFYYTQPLILEKKQCAGARFIERTACNWWRSENSKDLVRDYFILENTQGQYIWVYRNSAGEWYQHGIYS